MLTDALTDDREECKYWSECQLLDQSEFLRDVVVNRYSICDPRAAKMSANNSMEIQYLLSAL